ncbi:hypothetical protein Pmani_032560 [Petrolisthes manimaculis]|uniref:Uncharacterized protein n=1 Tax=Petrolisthes manimaculis TaxID=1843537 RepID=A0AAE1NST8_9EUCA|nr:hypothetical protein Pmani_032560 [Petrolisthes manimaculis]
MSRYLLHPTTTNVSLHLPLKLHLPPIVICPEQPFHLQTLKEFDSELPAPSENSQVILDTILGLHGLDPSLITRRVWWETGRTLGQIVHSLTVGKQEEKYNLSTQTSPHWRRVTTPLGPCHALLIPPLTSHNEEPPTVTFSLRKMPEIINLPDKHINYLLENAQQFCNSTCELLQLLDKSNPMSYYVFFAKVHPDENHDQNEELDELLRFFMDKDAWHTASLGTAKTPLNVIQVDTTMVDRRPISCKQHTSPSPGKDFSNCVDNYHFKKSGCVPLHPHSNVTLGESCPVSMIQREMFKEKLLMGMCQGPLEGQCQQRQWVHEVKHSLNMEKYTSGLYQVRLNLTSSKMRLEVEMEMYPLSQLASDIGGSLGLCLGLSLLSVSQCLGARPKYLLPEPKAARRLSGYHCQHLLYWTLVATLTLFTIVHSSISFNSYLTQPTRVSVTRATTTHQNSSPSANGIYHQVAARLASRALDCRPEPLPPNQQCVIDCLFTQALKQVSSVAPFVEVKDLPMCPAEHDWKYSPNYVVPSLAYSTATDPLLLRQCGRQCQSENETNITLLSYPPGVVVDHQYYYLTVIDFLCGLGGIISLYAGLFLSSAVPAVISLLPDSSPAASFIRRVITRVLESIIYLSGAVMTVLLLYRFIFEHPVSSKGSGQTLTLTHQPQVTVCYWPPFQYNLMTDNLSVSVDEAWATGAWSGKVSRAAATQGPGDITVRDSDYDLTSVLTIFNRCNNVQSRVFYNNLMVSFYYFSDYKDSVAVSLHGPHDPSFVSQVYQVLDLQVLTLTVVPVQYYRLVHLSSDHSPSYDNCVYICLHNKYSDNLGCRLPFVTWRPELPLCSLRKAQQYPTYPRQSKPPESVSEGREFSACHQSCRHLLTEFYLVWAKSASWLESGVNVVQQRSSFVALQEEDWCSFIKLCNDLGVVAGFTFGTSILSLFQALIHSWVPRHKTKA